MSTVRIQLRRGLASEWTAADTALNASGGLKLAGGEVGLETDTGTFKFGDGTTRWSALPYALENTLEDYVLVEDLGVANGVATLNSSGKVPASQLDISELSQDAVNTALVAGTGISKTYDDNANTITLAVSATTSNIAEGTNLYFTDERAQDAVNTAIVAGTNIARSYDDNANTITISMPNDIILSGYVDANQILGNSGAIDGELTAGSLTVSGNLTINGTTTTVNSTTLVVDDPIIKIADGNAANSVDIGFAGSRTISGTYSHTGLVKDATDGIWKLFSGVATEPGSTVDFTTWTKDDLSVGDVYTDEVFIGATQISTELAAKASSSSLTTHINDTLNVHGITNTANLAYTAGPTFTGTVVLPSTTSIGDVSSTEIGQLNGVTSSIQNQLNDKLDSSTAASTYATSTSASINGATFTGTVVLPSTTSIADVSATEIGYLNGVTSAIQTQLTQKTTDLDNHALDTTSIHGIADTAELATKTYADSAVTTHQNDSTNVHGIIDTAALATLTGTETLTGKTIALGSNTVSGTKAQFNSAMTDADFATLAGTETLTNKTITSPSGLVKADVGLENVDNTSDANKPVSTAAQTALNAKLNLSGGTLTGALTLSGAPTSDLHAATKLYVDGLAAGINFHQPVVAATMGNLAGTYNNGTNGVGATITAGSNGSIGTIDGASVSVGNRILLRAQTDAKQNGVYTVTAVGSAGAPWVVTRAADADNNPSGELANGDFTFVTSGSTNGSKGFIVSTTGTITIGTTEIQYAQFNASEAVIAGTNITKSGETISVVNNPTFSGLVTASASGVAFSDGTQIAEGVPSRTVIIQRSASNTLSGVERDDLIEMASASAMTLTIPTDSTFNFPIGTSIDVLQTSTGQVTIAGAGGVTVNGTPGLKLRTQWSSCTLFKRAANTWVVMGDLSA
jgi:hypothetical protein